MNDFELTVAGIDSAIADLTRRSEYATEMISSAYEQIGRNLEKRAVVEAELAQWRGLLALVQGATS